MDNYDRKTARLIGALLMSLGFLIMMLMTLDGMYGMQQQTTFPVMRNVLAFSVLCFFLYAIGLVLMWQGNKKEEIIVKRKF
jgi:hypothetical protein